MLMLPCHLSHITDDEIIPEVSLSQDQQDMMDDNSEESSEKEALKLVTWGQMQEATDILLAGLEEKASDFSQAEEVDLLLHRFKQFVLSSKSLMLKQKTLIDF